MIPKNDWTWFGNAGHFICSHLCQFHMTTEIGDFVISTVGEMPDTSPDGKECDVWHSIGMDRFYETMVFRTDGHCDSETCGCGIPVIVPTELDFKGYKTAKEAMEGHRFLCQKWSYKRAQLQGQKQIDEELARRAKEENQCQSA